MNSAIGQRLENSPRRRRIAVSIAIFSPALDLLIVTQNLSIQCRGALTLISFALLICILDGDLPSAGLRLSPKQGWRPWIGMSMVIATGVGILIAIWFGLWALMGGSIPIYKTAPTDFWHRFFHMCFVGPTIEDVIYRLVLCVPFVPIFGCWKTIGLSGILFAALHFAYGTPSPENLIGGFVLAWAFLKSESIAIPFIFHGAGNFLVLSAQTAAWYLLTPAA